MGAAKHVLEPRWRQNRASDLNNHFGIFRVSGKTLSNMDRHLHGTATIGSLTSCLPIKSTDRIARMLSHTFHCACLIPI